MKEVKKFIKRIQRQTFNKLPLQQKNIEINKSLKKLIYLLLFGTAIRLFFYFIGAEIYYGTKEFAVNGGDTWSWVECMQNLVHHGTYTIDLNYPDGKFYRPPGYAFFMMIFYFLSGFNLQIALKIMSVAQVLLDIITIRYCYGLILNTSNNEKFALSGALLYSIYPFSLVWTPVLYAEAPSLFFMFAGLYYITKSTTKKDYIISGLLLGFMVLLRVQTIFLIPAIALYLYIKNKKLNIFITSPVIFFFIAWSLVYGSWPIRNLLHGKFVPAVIETNHRQFSEDYVAFMHYIWSVQTDHRPQYDQILKGEKVTWPKSSYLQPGDSATLAHISYLCSTCSRGFSYFKASAGLINEPIIEWNDCSREIATTFNRLRLEQKQNNPMHYYFEVPVTNLKKVIFKSQLYDITNPIKKIATTILFNVRTLLILMGFIGIILNKRLKLIDQHFLHMILFFTLSWYIALCWIYRNIEIRYLLPTDVLLLIPAAITIIYIWKYIRSKNLIN